MGTLALWSRTVLWLGFILQVSLLVLLVRRRLAAEAWIFSGLLLFYAVRSLLLHELAPHAPPERYTELYSGLSLANLILQIALACELFIGVLHTGLLRWFAVTATVCASFLISALLTFGIAALLPPHSPVPADRGAIFTGIVFAILFGIAARVRLSQLQGWPRALLTGLAVTGLAGAIAECAKTVAAFHREGRAYVAWSYGNAAIYLLTLVFWIVAALRYGQKAETAPVPLDGYVRGTI